MKQLDPIHQVTHRIAASLKSILKSACFIGLLLPLMQSPVQALPPPGFVEAWTAFKRHIADAAVHASRAQSQLGYAQTSAQQQNVGGVRQGCEGARTAALAAVNSANQANVIAPSIGQPPSIAANTSAQNAVAWANQAANLLRIFTTPPAPLPTPRRILVPATAADNVANLKDKIGVVSVEFRRCCAKPEYAEQSGFIAGRFVMVTAAHGVYEAASGFAVKVIFHRNPDNKANVYRTMYTVALRKGYRDARNNVNPVTRNLGAIADNDIAIGMPSALWAFTPIFTDNGPLNTQTFNENYENDPLRAGVLNPYRTCAFVDGIYKFASTTVANMNPVLRDGKRFGSLIYYNPGLNPEHSGFGPGTSGGPLVEESHRSGYLWGGYTYLSVVGIVNSGHEVAGGTVMGIKVFNLTDLYFIDYYTQEGPGRYEYNPNGLDERQY